MGEFFTAACIILFIVAAIAYAGYYRQCPLCRKLFAGKRIHSEFLDQMQRLETVNRTTTVKIGGETTTITTPNQVIVTYTNIRDYYLCRHCGHQWTKFRTAKGK